MPKPFELLVSCGLGLSHSSYDQVSLLPHRDINASKTQVAINAATGNTVIRDTEFNIEDDGVTLKVGMIWNSKDSKGWRFAAVSKINVSNSLWQYLPKALNGQTLQLTEADDRIVTYSYDSGRQQYLCTEPDAGGISYIRFEQDSTYTRFFPKTGLKEKYDAKGLLLTKIFPSGKSIQYQYNANNEICITLPSTRVLKISPEEKNPNIQHLTLDDSQELAFFVISNNNPAFLQTNIIQPDSSIFKTTYEYKADSSSSIMQIQSDDATGACLSFDNSGTIKNFKEGVPNNFSDRNWSFVLNESTNSFTISDANKNSTIIGFDQQKCLASLQLPTDTQPKRFIFTNGLLATTFDSDDSKSSPVVKSLQYEAKTGLVSEIKDSLGRKKIYRYNTDPNSDLFGAKLAESFTESNDDKKTKGNNESPTCLFIYNANRQPVYEISPMGRVTRFINTTKLQKVVDKREVSAFYQFDKGFNPQDPTTYPTEENLNNWWDGLPASDLLQQSITHFDYDPYGRKNKEMKFTQLDEKQFSGQATPDTACIIKLLDPMGRLCQKDVAKIFDADEEKIQSQVTGFSYDNLSRITQLNEAIQDGSACKRITSYEYKANQTTIQFPNGLLKVIGYDVGGLEQKIARTDTDTKVALSKTYIRDNQGNVKKEIFEDGKFNLQWFDNTGRVEFKVTREGKLIEYLYDARDKTLCQREYYISIDISFIETQSIDDLRRLASEFQVALHRYRFYDSEEQLRFEVTVKNIKSEQGEAIEGLVTEHKYSQGNKIATIQYAVPIDVPDDISLQTLSGSGLIIQTPGKDKYTHYFYDADNLLIGEQVLIDLNGGDPVGYLKEYERDGLGNIIREIVYLNKSPFAKTLPAARPTDLSALETYHWYDNAKRRIATLDADKYLIAYTYYADGKPNIETIFKDKKENIDVKKRQIAIPTATAADTAISHFYDDLGRENKIINSQTQLQIDTEYDKADNITKQTLTDLKTKKTRVTQKRFNAFNNLIKEATPRMNVAGKQKALAQSKETKNNLEEKQQWIVHDNSTMTGLRLRSIDPLGSITLFYYNANRLIDTKITSDGTVTRYQYDLISQKPLQISQFYQRLDKDTLAAWQDDKNLNRNGFIDDATITKLLPFSNPNKDKIFQALHDAEGFPVWKKDSTGAEHNFFLDGLNEVETELHQTDQNKTLRVENKHDLRGNCTQVIQKDAKDQTVSNKTAKQFDDPLNRQTVNQTELGQPTTIQYQGLRTKILSEDKDRNRTITNDAFNRLLSETDWSNTNTTTHEYDDPNRTHTWSTPEGRKRSEILNAFDQVDLMLQNQRQIKNEFGVDGQLEATTFADGSKLSNSFDVMGLLFQNTAANSKVTQFDRNKVGQIITETDDLNGEKRQTNLTPDVFGNDEVIIRADNQKTVTELEDTGLTKIITTDPDGLGLVEVERYNLAGKLIQLQQGEVKQPNQYQENIQRDVFNREEKRTVNMMDEKIPNLVIKEQKYDAQGHTLESRDGLGNIFRKIYDTRGNLRFSIDAEGNVAEIRYDVNSKESWKRIYAIRLTPDQLNSLNVNSTPSDIAKLVKPDSQDSLRQRIYDKDGLLRFEINFLETGKARLTEWKCDEYGECYQKIQYVSSVLYPDDINCTEDNVPLYNQLNDLIAKDKFKNAIKNRVRDYCRNANGKIIFKRDSEGYVTEKRRDVNNKVIAVIKYATKYLDDFRLLPQDLRAKLDQGNPLNRAFYSVYDIFGNLRFQVDGETFIKEFRYDKANRERARFSYSVKLKDKLSKDQLGKLYQQLGDDSIKRDVNAICNNLANTVTLIANPQKDVYQKNEYDAGDRPREITDAESYTAKFAPNALGLNEVYTDKCNNPWTNSYDKAKRLQQAISPVVEVAKIKQDEKTGILSPQIVKTQVATNFEYDAASNQAKVTLGTSSDAKETLEPRITQKTYDQNNRFNGTQVNNVVVDDGTSNIPQKDLRPETKKDKISTQILFDAVNREMVNIDEKGVSRFKVYDRAGRPRFQIDGDGFVTEFQYEDSYSEPTKTLRHGKALTKDVIDAHQNGFSLAEMVQLSNQYTTANDRPITCVYDRRGLKQSATKAPVITAELDEKNNIGSAKVASQTTWEYNPFGEITQENTLQNSRGVYATTRRFYDNNGNEILTISPSGYVSILTYGMRREEFGSNVYVLLQRIECAKALDEKVDRNDLAKVLAQFYVDGQYQINAKDRIDDFEYDRRLLLTQYTVTGTDFFYQSILDKDSKPILIKGKKTITEKTEYDGEGRPIAYVLDSGDKRYLFRDARGDVIFETDFPTATDTNKKDGKGQPVTQYSLTQHLINAHRQPVATIKYLNAAQVKIDEKGQPQLTLPISDQNQDQQTYIMMDNRGNAILIQTPTGHQKYATFDELNRLIRSYHWVTGYTLDAGAPKKIWHLHGQRRKFDNRQNAILQEAIDDNTQTQTWKQINAFGDCEGEGPAPDDMRIKRRFDQAGHKYFTNEEQGIPTIIFPDARQQDAVTFRAAEVDLTSYSEDEAKAAKDLLDQDYATTYQQVQRTVVVRDLEGNAVQQQMPWYSIPAEDAPQTYQTSLIVSKDPKIGAGQCITWITPDEALLVPKFNLRVKGTTSWEELKVTTYTPEDKSAAGISGVSVDGRVTDCYEYHLDFYYQDPDSGKLAPNPSFWAEGEIMLDTGNYTNSKNLVWYMSNDKILILCGKIDDITGVELVQNGKAITRIAGTNLGNGKIIIDFSDQVSGNYQFKLLKSYKLLEEKMKSESKNSDSFNIYRPQFKTFYRAPDDCSPITISLENIPSEIKLIESSIFHTEKRQPGHDRYDIGVVHKVMQTPVGDTISLTIPTWMDQMSTLTNFPIFPSYNFYGIDSDKNKWFLGNLLPIEEDFLGLTGVIHYTQVPGNSKFYWDNSGQAFLLYNDQEKNNPQALLLKDSKSHSGILQLHGWANGSYRILCDESFNFDTGSLQVTPLSVSQSESTAIVGNLQIGSQRQSNNLVARELNLTDFCVTKCYLDMERVPDKYNATQLHYKWKTNAPRDHFLQITYPWFQGGKCQIDSLMPISDISFILPIQKNGYDYPANFQLQFLLDKSQSIGAITCYLSTFDDIIPVHTVATPSKITPINSPKIILDQVLFYDNRDGETIVDDTAYPDSYNLYFSPIPRDKINSVKFEYLTVTITGKQIWRDLPATLTQKGFVVSINSVTPGQYQYRFKALDDKQQNVDLKEVGIEYKTDGWAYNQTTIRKSNQAVFISKSAEEKVELVKTAVNAKYDRRHNALEVTNRSGQTTRTEFNVLGDPIKTFSSEVNVTDNNGKTTRQTLVTEHCVDANRHKVAEITPNSGTKVRMVNNQGDTLKEIDADGVVNTTTIDLLHRTTSVRDMSGVGKDVTYSTQDSLEVAEYKGTNGLSEMKVLNEEKNCIQERDTGQHLWHSDFDGNRNKITSINPLLTMQTNLHDLRTGVRTQFCDEDKNVQTWTLGEPGSIDEYMGNITGHTDFAGQKITFKLNFNKQLTDELGIADPKDPKLKNRGHIDEKSIVPVPARNIHYFRDEAGHEVEIVDDGAQLTTRKFYDKDDYCTALYFIANDGRVYQATHTEYDEMHRIARLYDTHMAVYMGYDANSNRRFARAYLYGPDPTKNPLKRESWYDYTTANRVMLRDCVLNMTKNPPAIELTTKQGMKIVRDANDVSRITAQITQDEKQGNLTTSLTYKPNSNTLQGTATTDQSGKVITSLQREINEQAGRYVVTQTKNDKTTTDETLNNPLGTITSQTHSEDDITQFRAITKQTNSGRPLEESNIYQDKKNNFTITDTYTHTPYYTDEIKTETVEVNRTTSDNVEHLEITRGIVNTTEDANGNITTVRGAVPDSFRRFVVNSQNCIVFKQSAQGTNYYFYAQQQKGKIVLMAYFGDIPDHLKHENGDYNPAVINLDVNHQALSPSYPPSAPSRYAVPRDMTYFEIAEELNYNGYAEQIALANGSNVNAIVNAGTTINIPPLYFEIPETSWNGSIPSMEKIIGSLYPQLPTPTIRLKPKPERHRHHTNWFKLILEAAAGVAIMTFAPELFAQVMGVTLGAGATAGLATADALESGVAYGAAGALASLSTQALEIGFGDQHSINFKSLAEGFITNAISGGLGQKFAVPALKAGENFDVVRFAKTIVSAEAVALAQQTALVATGLQRKFDWKSLETTALNATENQILTVDSNDQYVSKEINNGVGSVTSQIAYSVVNHQSLDPNAMAASLLGNLVGSYVGNMELNRILQLQKQQFQAQQPETLTSDSPPKNSRTTSKISQQANQEASARLKRYQSTVSKSKPWDNRQPTLQESLDSVSETLGEVGAVLEATEFKAHFDTRAYDKAMVEMKKITERRFELAADNYFGSEKEARFFKVEQNRLLRSYNTHVSTAANTRFFTQNISAVKLLGKMLGVGQLFMSTEEIAFANDKTRATLKEGSKYGGEYLGWKMAPKILHYIEGMATRVVPRLATGLEGGIPGVIFSAVSILIPGSVLEKVETTIYDAGGGGPLTEYQKEMLKASGNNPRILFLN